MGYTLMIGEAFVDVDLSERWSRVKVKAEQDPAAPIGSGGAVNRHCNECWPSYTAWSDFSRVAGLYSVFYAPRCPDCSYGGPNHNKVCHCGGASVWWKGKHGLLSSHPGCIALEQQHLDAFESALEAWPDEPHPEFSVGGADYVRLRLEWLVWWTRWALENCKYPSFANS